MNFKNILTVAAFVSAAVISQVASADGTTSSATVSSSATLVRPVTVTKDSDLAFGTIVLPSAGSGSVTLATNGTFTVTGTGAAGLASSTKTVGGFTVSGEGGMAITVTVPATFALSASGQPDLTVTTSNDMTGASTAQTLSNALGSAGVLAVKVGGSFPISSTTATAAYAGSFQVTAAYN